MLGSRGRGEDGGVLGSELGEWLLGVRHNSDVQILWNIQGMWD